MLPVSRKTYYFDMDEANATGTPEWKLLTDWTTDYELTDLSPKSMKAMADRIASDDSYAADYMSRSARRLGDTTSCNEDCRSGIVCENRHMDPYSFAQCQGRPIYDWSGDFLGTFRQAMLEPWVRVSPSSEAEQ